MEPPHSLEASSMSIVKSSMSEAYHKIKILSYHY